MKQSKKLVVASLAAVASLLLAGCGGGGGEETIKVTGEYLTGKTAKTVYNAYLGSAPTTLDATKSQSGENVTHLANFEDCLVMNDEFGILRKSLASSATRSTDGKVFTFKVRDDVPWVTYEGNIYEYKGVKYYVSPEDFVTTAKLILDFTNNSEIYYMYTLFVANAWEYYCYTMMNSYISEKRIINGFDYSTLKGDFDAQASKLMDLIREYSGNEPDEVITKDMISQISRFERVGVKADANKRTVTYTLRERADFFPTMLTYTPFTPICKTFYDRNKAAYGTNNTKILYCGPYICSEFTATTVKYIANPTYIHPERVHIKKVNYQVVTAALTYAEMREAFNRGEVDGFSLNADDEVGWRDYITGPDNTNDIRNPYNPLVNSRELDDVTYTYHFVLNQNRSTDPTSFAHSTIYEGMTNDQIVAEIENTNRALKIRELRKLVLDGIDLTVFNERYKAPEGRDQYQMNTFTPRGYVYDEASKDYVDYYYEEYARQKGLVEEGATAEAAIAAGKAAVGPQQINGVNHTDDASIVAKYPWLSLEKTRNDAINAVKAYNTQIATSDADKIKLPVIIEYNSTAALDPKDASFEQDTVVTWNERANGCTISKAVAEAGELELCSTKYPGTPEGEYPYFRMKDTKISNSSNFTSVTNNGYYTLYTGWGWVGDYADPLTYMHCYVTRGEMAKMSGNNSYFNNYKYNAETDSFESDIYNPDLAPQAEGNDHMFYDYNNAVDTAKAENGSLVARFKLFAKAEYMLLNELHIIKPSYMPTQGYSASVSRAAGYENPNAHYGLADHILTGLWVLQEVPTGAERQQARDKQAENKAKALAEVGNNTINPIYDN